MSPRYLLVGVITLLTAAMIGCASRSRTADATMRIGPEQLSPEEIGGEVTSFADNYVSLLVHVGDQYYDLERAPKDRAKANAFLVDTTFAAYIVASDPNPVTAMIDMIVLVSLTKWSAETHWTKALGDEASILIDATRKGYNQVWQIAQEMLEPEQQQVLKDIIRSWTEDNASQRFVANVRFADFSEERRQMHATKRGAQSLFGLFGLDPLANLDPTTAEIERSRMLAERTFFYLKRLPMLITASAFQVYFDIAATDEAAQFRANVRTFADAAGDFVRVVDGLPHEIGEEIAAERQRAVIQIQEAVAVERQAAIDAVVEAVNAEGQRFIETLHAEEPGLHALLTELRQTLDSGKALADALHVLKPPAHPDRKPLDMTDVHAVVEQTTLAADGLNQLVQSMDQALAPDDLEARLARLDVALERARFHGQKVVNRVFFLAAALVVIIFGLSLAKVLIQRRLGPATK